MRFRLLIIPVALALMVVGFLQLRSTPVDVLPEFTPVSVEVQTEALGLSAVEVEQLVTVPMEQDLLNGVAWLAQIRSESVAGLSSIELVFQPGTDLYQARQMVAERLAQAHALPHVSKPPVMIQPLSSTSRVMMIGLSSQDVSLIEMSVLARWQIRPRLMGVPGVANVAIWGQRERQLQVQVDPQRLSRLGVTLNQVITTTGNAMWSSPLSFVEASTPGTGGFVDTPNQRLPIRHVLPIRTPQDLAQVPVEGTTGKPQRLGDVATVVEDHQPLIGDAIVNNGPGLLLVVEKSPGANTLEVTRGVEDALAGLRPGLSGVEIDSEVFRPATFIETARRSLTTTLLVSLLLVVLLLGLFFFDWRTALISVLTIPISLAAALLVLDLRGGTLNVMVLAGLVMALVVLVDSAVVDIDNIKRRLRQHREEGGTASATTVVVRASTEVRSPIIYGTVITLVAATPLFFLPGLTDYFATPLTVTYILAVLASMVVALAVTPAFALVLLAKAPLRRAESPAVGRLRRGYLAMLPQSGTRSRTLLGVTGVVVLLGLLAVPALAERSANLVPTLQDRDLLIRWEAPPGTSRPEMVRVMTQASTELRGLTEVRDVGVHVGRAITSDQVVGINSGEIWVSLDQDADYTATTAAVRRVVGKYPGFAGDIRSYPEERLREVQAGSGKPVVVRIFGQDLTVLRQKADEVRTMLAGIDGVVSPTVDTQKDEPTAEIEVDLAAAQRYGLKPGDVRRAAATLVSGLEVGSLFEEQKVFEVVVWSTPASRSSLASIEQLLIDTPNGGHVRLSDVADVRVAPNPTVIRHDGVSRRIDVSADISGRSLAAVSADVNEKLAAIQFPLEYHAELLGDSADLAAARRLAWSVGIAAAIAVLLLLQAAFGSWRLASIFFVLLPVALVGGVLGAFLAGAAFSLGTFAGLLAVFGLAVRNGILLIRHYQHLERQQGEPFGPGLVWRGASERFAPIVITSIVAALALLPFIILGGAPGHEVIRPMAAVILGGLVTSLLLNLFLLPAVYLRFGSGPRRDEPEATSTEERVDEPDDLALQATGRGGTP